MKIKSLALLIAKQKRLSVKDVATVIESLIELELKDIEKNMADNTHSPLKALEDEVNKRQGVELPILKGKYE